MPNSLDWQEGRRTFPSCDHEPCPFPDIELQKRPETRQEPSTRAFQNLFWFNALTPQARSGL